MTDSELQRLAHMIVLEQASNEKWMAAFAKACAGLQQSEQKLISAHKAADMLGISVWQLYRIKDDEEGKPRFSYTKGKSKSSPLKFNAATLLDEFERYLSQNKNKLIRLRPVKVAY